MNETYISNMLDVVLRLILVTGQYGTSGAVVLEDGGGADDRLRQ
jgi:hypothetical protein